MDGVKGLVSAMQGLGRHFIVRVLTRECGMKGVQPIKTTALL